MKFITAISISLLAAFASAQGSPNDGLSHPTPAPDVGSSTASPSVGPSSSSLIPPGSLAPRPTRMVKKRSESPVASITPSTTVVVPKASSSLYNIQETPL